MEIVMQAVKALISHLDEIVLAMNLVVTGLIGLFVLIPGEHPEKELRQFAEFIAKFSVKKQ